MRTLYCLTLAVAFLSSASGALANEVELSRLSGLSPFDGCTADDPSSQSGEFTADSEVEPWVAVNPRNANHWVASWQQDRWTNGGARGLVAAVTFDRGRTWMEVVLPELAFCSGGEFLRASDPWLSFAPNGDVYHAALVVSQSLIDLLEGNADSGRSAMLVQKSTDGGLTWSAPIHVIDEDFNGLNDKQAITADPFDEDFAYLVWDRLDFTTGESVATFARTTDGGVTWEPPTMLYSPGSDKETLGNQIVVLPNGTLINFFDEISFDEDENEIDTLVLKYSPDRGETWLPEGDRILVAPMQPTFNLMTPDGDEPIRGGEELFDVTVDPRTGTLYAVWQDGSFSDFAHESTALSVSHDGGLTWTAPVQINQTPTDLPEANQQAFLPTVEANDRGFVAITYYDFRAAGGSEALTDVWAILCRPDRIRDCSDPFDWSPEIRLTEESFDFLAAPSAGALFLGDYVGLAATGGSFLAVFPATEPDDPASVFAARFEPEKSNEDDDGCQIDPAPSGPPLSLFLMLLILVVRRTTLLRDSAASAQRTLSRSAPDRATSRFDAQ